MNTNITMPAVMKCSVKACAYNREMACHARAITVGGMEECPQCDTYLKESKHTSLSVLAGVGACKVMDCKFNEEFECQADGIEVAMDEDHADCMTFAMR